MVECASQKLQEYHAKHEYSAVVGISISCAGDRENECVFHVKDLVDGSKSSIEINSTNETELLLEKPISDMWDEIIKRYNKSREDMSIEEEREFVLACFEIYETEGFAKRFWTPYSDYSQKCGEPFEVIRRCTEEDSDLCQLPSWNIMFADGIVIQALPEEIIESEVIKNREILSKNGYC